MIKEIFEFLILVLYFPSRIHEYSHYYVCKFTNTHIIESKIFSIEISGHFPLWRINLGSVKYEDKNLNIKTTAFISFAPILPMIGFGLIFLILAIVIFPIWYNELSSIFAIPITIIYFIICMWIAVSFEGAVPSDADFDVLLNVYKRQIDYRFSIQYVLSRLSNTYVNFVIKGVCAFMAFLCTFLIINKIYNLNISIISIFESIHA